MSQRTRPLLWILIVAVSLGGIGLFLLRRTVPPVTSASPPAASSAHPWRPRRGGKERATSPARRPSRTPNTARGRVVAAAGGAPIAGATVTIYRGEESLAELTTDERGAFGLQVAAAQVQVEVTARGFVTAYETMYLPREPLTISLVRGAVLTGQVVRDDTGEPVAGARVEPGSIAGEIDEDWIGRTDASGRFRIEGLTAGEYKPTAGARGLFAQATSRVTLSAGEVGPPVTIRMRTAATLRGRLELSATQQPCVEGSVTLTSRVHGDLSALADAGGRVVFDAVPPGTWEVTLACEGHVDRETAPPLTVSSADLDVLFTLHEKLAITGTVVTPGGEPVPDVYVNASLESGAGEAGDRGGSLSGEDGRFTLRDLSAGTYDLTASDAVDAPKVRVVLVSGAPATDVRLVRDVVSLRGRAVDTRGEPIAGASVTATRDPSGNGSFETEVDRDGRFAIEHFGPGIVTLKVSVGGKDVELEGGPATITLPLEDEVTLVALVPDGRIDGTVTGSGGPRAGVEIAARCSGVDLASAVTDDAGRFELRHLAPSADCTLHAVAPNGESAVATAVHAGAHVQLALRPAARLKGTVAGAGASFLLSIDADDYMREEVFFASGGAWDVPGLPAGRCTVRVRTDGGHAAAGVTLAPGEERALDLVLQPGTGDEEEEPH